MSRIPEKQVRPASIQDLLDVLCTVCSTMHPDDMARRFGNTQPSRRSARYVRIEPTPYASVAAIELRPRTDDHFGVAVLELADPTAWSLQDLSVLAGPLTRVPPSPGGGVVLQGIWEDPTLPARGVLYIRIGGPDDDRAAPVEEISIRSESVRPGNQ